MTTEFNELKKQIKKDLQMEKDFVHETKNWDLNHPYPQLTSLLIPQTYFREFHRGTLNWELNDKLTKELQSLIGWDPDWDMPDTIQQIESIPEVLLDIEDTYKSLALEYLLHDGPSDEDVDMLPYYTESVLLFAAATNTWGYCNRIIDTFMDNMAKHFGTEDFDGIFENHPVPEEAYLNRIKAMQPALHILKTWGHVFNNPRFYDIH